ncbi:hypothetical protein ACFL0M_16130 [Thermodesulfobacteriota bacterium]
MGGIDVDPDIGAIENTPLIGRIDGGGDCMILALFRNIDSLKHTKDSLKKSR